MKHIIAVCETKKAAIAAATRKNGGSLDGVTIEKGTYVVAGYREWRYRKGYANKHFCDVADYIKGDEEGRNKAEAEAEKRASLRHPRGGFQLDRKTRNAWIAWKAE